MVSLRDRRRRALNGWSEKTGNALVESPERQRSIEPAEPLSPRSAAAQVRFAGVAAESLSPARHARVQEASPPTPREKEHGIQFADSELELEALKKEQARQAKLAAKAARSISDSSSATPPAIVADMA